MFSSVLTCCSGALFIHFEISFQKELTDEGNAPLPLANTHGLPGGMDEPLRGGGTKPRRVEISVRQERGWYTGL